MQANTATFFTESTTLSLPFYTVNIIVVSNEEMNNMKWWVYKCNSRNLQHQRAYGDWRDFFAKNRTKDWGSSNWIPELNCLNKSDMVIAYQTNINEIVGLVEVHRTCERDSYVYLTPIEQIRVKVRPLKKADPKINAIPAFKPGPIQTIYDISFADARRILTAAGATYGFEPDYTPKAKDMKTPPKKVEFTTYRILRDTVLAREVKQIYNYKCQVCQHDALKLGDGSSYAEAHHIQPLGSPHSGLDVPENIICVCPICHVLLDYGAIKIHASRLLIHDGHKLEQKYIDYHNNRMFTGISPNKSLKKDAAISRRSP